MKWCAGPDSALRPKVWRVHCTSSEEFLLHKIKSRQSIKHRSCYSRSLMPPSSSSAVSMETTLPFSQGTLMTLLCYDFQTMKIQAVLSSDDTWRDLIGAVAHEGKVKIHLTWRCPLLLVWSPRTNVNNAEVINLDRGRDINHLYCCSSAFMLTTGSKHLQHQIHPACLSSGSEKKSWRFPLSFSNFSRRKPDLTVKTQLHSTNRLNQVLCLLLHCNTKAILHYLTITVVTVRRLDSLICRSGFNRPTDPERGG